MGGRIRPVMALKAGSEKPVTPDSTRIGVPTAPQATGAVLAIKQSVAAWKGSKPRPMRNEPAIATGAPPPPVPSRKAPKQKAIRMSWMPLVGRKRRDRFLHHLELARLDGDVIQEDRGDDDPGDPEQAEDDPEAARRRRPSPPACERRRSARTTAIRSPDKAATQTRVLNAMSEKKSETTGKAETDVESGQASSGS